MWVATHRLWRWFNGGIETYEPGDAVPWMWARSPYVHLGWVEWRPL